jgi:hypothetical protein
MKYRFVTWTVRGLFLLASVAAFADQTVTLQSPRDETATLC